MFDAGHLPSCPSCETEMICLKPFFENTLKININNDNNDNNNSNNNHHHHHNNNNILLIEIDNDNNDDDNMNRINDK